MKKLFVIVFAMFYSQASAHEMTPTYFELSQSYIDNVLKTTIELFNRREDVKYYEINVYDKDWKEIPFVTTNKIVHLEYLAKESIDIYIRKSDRDKVAYICTLSKFIKSSESKTNVASRICSKIK